MARRKGLPERTIYIRVIHVINRYCMVRIETKKNANKGREKLMDKFQKAF
jgi:hypothetical protein